MSSQASQWLQHKLREEIEAGSDWYEMAREHCEEAMPLSEGEKAAGADYEARVQAAREAQEVMAMDPAFEADANEADSER